MEGPDRLGWTALLVAAGAGVTDVVEVRHWRVEMHDMAMRQQLLVNRGANMSAVDQLGATALHKAAERGHSAAVEVYRPLALHASTLWSILIRYFSKVERTPAPPTRRAKRLCTMRHLTDKAKQWR